MEVTAASLCIDAAFLFLFFKLLSKLTNGLFSTCASVCSEPFVGTVAKVQSKTHTQRGSLTVF